MKINYNDSPIEVLGLDAGIVKKLKQIFIYTVGQLQLKTEEALKESLIFQEEPWEIMKISNVLVKKTGRGFAKEIEPQDQIEKIRKGIGNFRGLKRSGLCRISELIRMSEAELKTINGIDTRTCEKIEEILREYYEEQYETIKKQMIGENPDAISLGHFNIPGILFLNFREGEIYTIRDYQRRSDAEMLKLPGIGESAINKVNKELLILKIPRHIEEEDRIEVLNISKGRAECLDGMGIYTLTQLGNTAVGNLLDKPEIKAVGTEKILVEYLMELLVRQELQRMSEIELLKRVKFIMKDIKSKTGDKKTKFRDILEKLRQESEGEVMERRGSN